MFASRSLEIHVVDHCNLDCVGCSHESPLSPHRAEEPRRLSQALSVLFQFYRPELIKLLGGEPLLHRNLADVVAAIKERTDRPVRLITNGVLLPRRLDSLRQIDEIHISSYPGSAIPSDEELAKIARELGAPITIEAFPNFRWHRSTTRGDPSITDRVFATCQLFHRWQCHTVRDGRFYPCPPAATWSARTDESVDLLAKGLDHHKALERLLVREAPFDACGECLGSVGIQYEHRLGWHKQHDLAPEPGVDYDFLQRLEVNPDATNGCFVYKRVIMPDGNIVTLSVD